MSLRNTTPLLPELKDGTYPATLVGFAYFAETETASDGYQLQIALADRIITERKFDQSFSISISHLRKQLKDESIIPATLDEEGRLINTSSEIFLKNLMNDKTPFNIYVEHVSVQKRNQAGLSNQRNINFLPPLPKTPAIVGRAIDDGGIEV